MQEPIKVLVFQQNTYTPTSAVIVGHSAIGGRDIDADTAIVEALIKAKLIEVIDAYKEYEAKQPPRPEASVQDDPNANL
ncbi:MAG: hypothetical protein EBR82_22515 [Caulobacteraceae bacterium]|nr:hypothetical protein [Caulobacteraceae bacterium]